MIKCSNCERMFRSEDELLRFIERKVIIRSRPIKLVMRYKPCDIQDNDEIYLGCSKCKTDKYLIDLKEEEYDRD